MSLLRMNIISRFGCLYRLPKPVGKGGDLLLAHGDNYLHLPRLEKGEEGGSSLVGEILWSKVDLRNKATFSSPGKNLNRQYLALRVYQLPEAGRSEGCWGVCVHPFMFLLVSWHG